MQLYPEMGAPCSFDRFEVRGYPFVRLLRRHAESGSSKAALYMIQLTGYEDCYRREGQVFHPMKPVDVDRDDRHVNGSCPPWVLTKQPALFIMIDMLFLCVISRLLAGDE